MRRLIARDRSITRRAVWPASIHPRHKAANGRASPSAPYVATMITTHIGGDGQQLDLIPAPFRRPMLFIASSCDTVIGLHFQQRQQRCFRTADLVVVPNAGQEMFLEQPEASVEAVRAFLTRPI
jgi:pimeloyl-ACP methyl ester carboxylesterase